jgi:hypothetical protein
MDRSMFVFGHIGFGRLLVGSRGRAMPAVPLLVGMLLPDLIDKPLYYADISSFVSCTRTFGHTGLFVAAVLILAAVRRSSGLLALGLGMATHLGLDCAMDVLSPDVQSALTALAWPFRSPRFAVVNMSIADHLKRLLVPPVMITELAGLAILVWEYRRWRPAVRTGV